jgi:prepilin-type N-terminal cleavage/methylation domain-containing protein
MTRPRPGFTLVELLVSLALLGVVLAGVLGALGRQQRLYRDLADVIESRRQVRHALAVLQPELRAIAADALAAEGSDVLLLADSVVELRAALGSSVVCGHDSASQLDLPALAPSSGSTLTAWHAAPRAGDAVLVYDEGPADDGADDRWRAHDVRDLSEGRAYCATSPFMRPADAALARFRVTLAGAPPLSPTIRAGAPVRFARRTRYSLYRASAGGWFLGQREWSGRWSTIQPVSGPYRALAPGAPSASGLTFAAVDSAGAPAAAGARAVAILATVRARTQAPLASAGFAHGWRDVGEVMVAAPAWWRP